MFVKKNDKPKPSLDLSSILGKKEVSADIGIELEFEGNAFPKSADALPKAWRYHQDGSLRGQDNAEYVLTNPLKFDEAEKAIDDIFRCLHKFGTEFSESNRTSVHVHLNVTKFHLNRLAAFCGLYFCFEEILTEWCGDTRVGNLFCLRGKDAPDIVSATKEFIKNDGRYGIDERYHYGALNLQALDKFGSLEFRTLRGVTEKETILNWIAILRRLYEVSAEYPDPRRVCTEFSGNGPMGFFDTIFGAQARTILNGISWSTEQVRDSLYEGIRLAQDICYCRDWSMFKALEIRSDPFGRDKKSVARKVMQNIDIEAQAVPVADSDPEFDDFNGPQPTPNPVGWGASNAGAFTIQATAPSATWNQTWDELVLAHQNAGNNG